MSPGLTSRMRPRTRRDGGLIRRGVDVAIRAPMTDKFEWPQIEDEPDKVIIRNVREHGCHIVGLADGEPRYAFSIGLFLNYGQAELIIFGLDSIDSCNVINSIRDRAAAGRKYVAGEVCDDLLVESRICFVEVPLRLYGDYL